MVWNLNWYNQLRTKVSEAPKAKKKRAGSNTRRSRKAKARKAQFTDGSGDVWQQVGTRDYGGKPVRGRAYSVKSKVTRAHRADEDYERKREVPDLLKLRGAMLAHYKIRLASLSWVVHGCRLSFDWLVRSGFVERWESTLVYLLTCLNPATRGHERCTSEAPRRGVGWAVALVDRRFSTLDQGEGRPNPDLIPCSISSIWLTLLQNPNSDCRST